MGAISDFDDLVRELHLAEVACAGSAYTWARPGARLWQKRDRVLISQKWVDLFPSTMVEHLPFHQSDHCPILFKFGGQHPWGPVAFRFLDAWALHPGFRRFVHDAGPRNGAAATCGDFTAS